MRSRSAVRASSRTSSCAWSKAAVFSASAMPDILPKTTMNWNTPSIRTKYQGTRVAKAAATETRMKAAMSLAAIRAGRNSAAMVQA